MNGPTFMGTLAAGEDTHAIVSYLPVPGFGVLPVNAYTIDADEPVLVDTGLAALRSEFLSALRTLVDPTELRWIWITHTDPDHLGNLAALLEIAPHVRVITNYLGMGKMGLHLLPLDRVYLINPGQTLNIGDRELTAIGPPCYDAPETVGLIDHKTGHFFSADCFGALLSAPTETADEIDRQSLQDGCVTWATVDAPWMPMVDSGKFQQSLNRIQMLNASMILSAHLPPAKNLNQSLLDFLARAQQAPAFVGPDQQALEAMLAPGVAL